MLTWNNRKYETILRGLCETPDNTLGAGIIDVPFKKRMDDELEAIHEGLTMENMGEEKIGKKKSLKVRDLLIENLGSKFLDIMMEKRKALNLRDKLIE